MSGWRDKVKQNASFRGVPFVLLSTRSEIGRRTVVWDLPYQDVPAFTDMGAARRTFRVKGLLVGDNYTAKRDELAWAFSAPGLGVLKVPLWGDQRVVLERPAAFVENGDGSATFEASFVEAEDGLFPVIMAGSRAAVDRAIAELDAAMEKHGEEAEQALAKGRNGLNYAEHVKRMLAEAVERLGTFREWQSEQFSFEEATGGLLADDFLNVYKNVRELGLYFLDWHPLALWARTLTEVARTFEPPPQFAHERRAEDEWRAQVQAAVLVDAFEIMLSSQFDTVLDVWEAQDACRSLWDDLVMPVDVWRPMRGVALATWAALEAKAADLPQVQTVTTDRQSSSLEVAYAWNGTPTAIEQVNRPEHPGFLPAGEVLVVRP